MNLHLEKVKENFNFFKKDKAEIKNISFRSILLSLLGDISLSSFVTLVASYTLNKSNLLSYVDQINLLGNARFNNFMLVMFGLFIAIKMLEGTIQTAKQNEELNKEFTSVIWYPIKLVILTGFLIPQSNGATALSEFVAALINTFLM